MHSTYHCDCYKDQLEIHTYIIIDNIEVENYSVSIQHNQQFNNDCVIHSLSLLFLFYLSDQFPQTYIYSNNKNKVN